MRIIGHIKVSVGLATASFSLGFYMGYDYTVNITLAVMLAIGSVSPDFLEMGIIKHRTYTHYPWFYVAIIIVAIHLHEISLSDTTFISLIGFAIGSLVHILCDWPYYRGIPLFLPTKQVKLLGLHFTHKTNLFLERLALFIIGTTAIFLAYSV